MMFPLAVMAITSIVSSSVETMKKAAEMRGEKVRVEDIDRLVGAAWQSVADCAAAESAALKKEA